MTGQQVECVMRNRIQAATPVELNRLCLHLGLAEGVGSEEIERAYLDAADNTVFNVIRNLVPNDAPTYSKAIRLIFKKMRPYSASLDETWRHVKSLKFWDYRSAIEDLDDEEYEEFCKLHELNPRAPDSREQYQQYMALFNQMSEVVQAAHLNDVQH